VTQQIGESVRAVVEGFVRDSVARRLSDPFLLLPILVLEVQHGPNTTLDTQPDLLRYHPPKTSM